MWRPCSNFSGYSRATRKPERDSLVGKAVVGNLENLRKFRVYFRKKFFTVRVVIRSHGLPREAVNAPSLEVFKNRLDKALGNLVQCKMSQSMAVAWN